MISKILLILGCFSLLFGCSEKVEPTITSNDPLQAYPNPMEREAIITVTATSTAGTLAVFDPTGSIIFEQSLGIGSHQFTIDASQRPSGKYQVEYKTGSTVYSETLLKL